MKKKEYINPELTVRHLSITQLLTTSTGSGSLDPEEEVPEDEVASKMNQFIFPDLME